MWRFSIARTTSVLSVQSIGQFWPVLIAVGPTLWTHDLSSSHASSEMHAPRSCTAAAPSAQPSTAHSCKPRPISIAARNPAQNASPAPTVSTTGTLHAGDTARVPSACMLVSRSEGFAQVYSHRAASAWPHTTDVSCDGRLQGKAASMGGVHAITAEALKKSPRKASNPGT